MVVEDGDAGAVEIGADYAWKWKENFSPPSGVPG